MPKNKNAKELNKEATGDVQDAFPEVHINSSCLCRSCAKPHPEWSDNFGTLLFVCFRSMRAPLLPERPAPSWNLLLSFPLSPQPRLQVSPWKWKKTSKVQTLTSPNPHLSNLVGQVQFLSPIQKPVTNCLFILRRLFHVSQNNRRRMTWMTRSGTTEISSWAASSSVPVCTNPKAFLVSAM